VLITRSFIYSSSSLLHIYGFVFHSRHLPPPYENPLLKVHLYSIPNTLAFIVLVSKFQIPCIYRV
jgi:hypothetical protein